MNRKSSVFQMCAAALLIAMGILIPMVSLRFSFEPMSFTLASHVSIFIAMFISPAVAVVVVVGTTLGFFLSASIVVALRAASHIVFALIGSLYLMNHPRIWKRPLGIQIFSLCMGLVHALCEMVVVLLFYFSGMYAGESIAQLILLLVGVGTLVHSMVDFIISQIIVQALGRFKPVRVLFQVFK